MITMKNGSTITMEAGEKLRGGDMITLGHKTTDWRSPAPQEEDEMVCVRVKMDEYEQPVGIMMESTPVKDGFFYACKDRGTGGKEI